eukprot:scaffold6750_cov160-Amphora_coffeaeformis.AAC.10
MSLAWCDEADAVLDDLTAEKTSTDYVLFQIDNPKKKPIAVMAEAGQGGREGVANYLQSHAADDAILAGVFLCSAIDERGSVVSVRRKYIQFTWIGPSVSVMVKGKLSSWSGALREKFPAAALNLQLSGSDLHDLDAQGLQAQLLAAGGAHKPTRYSFTNRTLIGSLSLDEAAAAAAEEERRRREAEIEAQRQAAAERRRLAEERKKKEAEEKARLEAEHKAAEEAERQRAEERKKIEVEEKARLEAERKAAEEAERQRLETERQAREAEEAARRKAEEEARLAKIHADEARRKAEKEAARRAAEEAERQQLEAERLAREEAERQRTKILIDANATLNGKTLVLLVSNLTSNYAQTNAQDRVRTMLDGLGLPKKEIEEVDGSDPNRKDERNELFALSGIRAKYPQIFMKDLGGKLTFVGDFDAMEYYNDTGTLAQTLGVVSSKTKRTVAVADCSAALGKMQSEERPAEATNVAPPEAATAPTADPVAPKDESSGETAVSAETKVSPISTEGVSPLVETKPVEAPAAGSETVQEEKPEFSPKETMETTADESDVTDPEKAPEDAPTASTEAEKGEQPGDTDQEGTTESLPKEVTETMANETVEAKLEQATTAIAETTEARKLDKDSREDTNETLPTEATETMPMEGEAQEIEPEANNTKESVDVAAQVVPDKEEPVKEDISNQMPTGNGILEEKAETSEEAPAVEMEESVKEVEKLAENSTPELPENKEPPIDPQLEGGKVKAASGAPSDEELPQQFEADDGAPSDEEESTPPVVSP